MLWNSPSPVFEQQYPPVSGRLIKKTKKTKPRLHTTDASSWTALLHCKFPKAKTKTNKRPGRREQMMHVNDLVLSETGLLGPGQRWGTDRGLESPESPAHIYSARQETHQSSPPVTLQHDSRAAGQLSKMAISLQTSWRDVSFYYGGCKVDISDSSDLSIKLLKLIQR